MQVRKLSGLPLAHWVRMAEFNKTIEEGAQLWETAILADLVLFSWNQAGPIIEREGIPLKMVGYKGTESAWVSETPGAFFYYGRTALEAAMRAYVASKFGAEVPDLSPV